MAELDARLQKEVLRKQRAKDLIDAHNRLSDATHRCTWSQSPNQDSYLPKEDNESWHAWFDRLDVCAVGKELVHRWPPLITAIHDNAQVLGYDPEEFVAYDPTAPLERDARASFTAKQFHRIWKAPKDKKLLKLVADEVGRAFRKDKWTIEWYHVFFDHLHARVRFAYDAALRRQHEAVAAEVSRSIIQPAAPPNQSVQNKKIQEPKHAEDFSWLIDAYGREYFFSPQQRVIIHALFETWIASGRKDGCGLSLAALEERLEFRGVRFRLDNLFRGNTALGTILRRPKRGIWALYPCTEKTP